MRWFRPAALAAVLGLAGLAQQAPAQEAPAASAEAAARDLSVVAAAVAGYIRPAYATFSERANALQVATAVYCTGPTPDSRAALATAFRAAVVGYAGIDFLRFGPAATDTRIERLFYFPDPRNVMRRQLAQLLAQNADLRPEDLAGQSVAVQGLPALEALLLSDGVDPAAPDFAARCRLATVVAANIAAIAGSLDGAWNDPAAGYSALLTKPGADNPVYRTPREAATEILKALSTGLEMLRDQRLLPAMGKTAEEAKASRLPFVTSGDTGAFLAAEIDAIARLFTASGLGDGLPADYDWAGGSLLFELQNADTVLAKLPVPVADALVTDSGRQALIAVRNALGAARERLVQDVAVGNGLTVGFNALDGD